LKTLIIDNHDSFTYNLVHLFAVANQEEPVVVPNDAQSWAALAAQGFDNIVISPGPGRPDRARDVGISADAIAAARVPILGVCLGHQAIAIAQGGRVVPAPEPIHGRTSLVRHQGDVLFAGISPAFDAVRYHSLIVSRPLPESLAEIAWTEDGLLMALRHRHRPIWGVQFHPESILAGAASSIIENFRDLTRQLRPNRPVTVRSSAAQAKKPVPETKPGRRAYWRELPRAIDTEAAFLGLFGTSASAFWLDSSLVVPGFSRWSFLGDTGGPHAALLSYDRTQRRLDIQDRSGTRAEQTGIFDYLERRRAGAPSDAPPCPFRGGHVGWFGYELCSELGSSARRRATTPDALFIQADRFIAVDHIAGRSYAVAVAPEQDEAISNRWLDETVARLSVLTPAPPPRLGTSSFPIVFTLDRSRAAYIASIEQCLDWIRQGETYQVCLTNELVCEAGLDTLDLYRIMRRLNPAPHAAFLRWPGGAILSASPERFLSVDTGGKVEAKPIKGTMARAVDPALDLLFAEKLRSSEKDRAENLMIVDLLRNDLARVCIPGSVAVPSLMAVESYATVHQLVSTIEGALQPENSAIDLVRAAFPGGSMTGAPKQRTLELIDRLEGRARGIYSGALGWIGDDGAMDLSIVIRTILAQGRRLSIGVGGGIVAQSIPENEFDEMLLKAQASIRAIVTAATGGFGSDRYSVEGVTTSDSVPMSECVAK
jgi:para-aminobenzoate synthetase